MWKLIWIVVFAGQMDTYTEPGWLSKKDCEEGRKIVMLMDNVVIEHPNDYVDIPPDIIRVKAVCVRQK